MLQVTAHSKGNGNELNPSWDELNGESANDICELGISSSGRSDWSLRCFLADQAIKIPLFMDFQFIPPKQQFIRQNDNSLGPRTNICRRTVNLQ
jgi:hypothetical protein